MTVWRHLFIVIVFLAAVVGLVGRVVYLNVTEREFLQDQGDARSVRPQDIPAWRGVIYDRHGEPLAVSTPVVAVWVDPERAKFDGDDLARLAEVLELTPRAIREKLKLNATRRFVYLKRHVAHDGAAELEKLNLPGVDFQREYRRYYPASETSAHVIGKTDIDDVGIEGVEFAFDGHLKGQPGRKLVLRDRRGETIKDLAYLSAPEYGQDLTLSLDLRLQYLAYRELKGAVTSHRAASGSLVMVEVGTGAILAMANLPSYNPNDILNSDGARNRAVTDRYEPGSTIKPFTALAALSSGQYEPDTTIDTAPGYFQVGGKLVEDPVNRGTITLTEALQKSSQVGFAKIALSLPPRAVLDVLDKAGFTTPVITGLPGEVMSTVAVENLSRPVERASLAYGYGLSTSPLQLAQAYLVLAAGGLKIPVSILKSRPPSDPPRVFSAEDVGQVLEMMETVTGSEGTAPMAGVPGYRIAGKTGTTRVVGVEGYDDERHVALFAGIAPLTNPRFVIVVVINEPRGDARSGGAVAAPVFGRVATRALRLLGVRPDGDPL